MRAASILLGVIGRPHGVRGLVHVTSYAVPPEAIAGYGPLADESGRRFVLRWRGEGVAELAEIVNGAEARVADRTGASRLTNTRLYIERDQLPATAEDEFYLADLVGLAAVDATGAPVGIVAAVHDYGAGASLEIARESGALVVPFTRTVVPVVDVAGGLLVVAPPLDVDTPHPHPPRESAATSPAESGRGEERRTSPLPRLRERSARTGAPGEGGRPA